MTGTDVLIETEIYQKYDLIIDNNCCGRCFTHNKRIVALDVNLPNHWSIFYCAGNDYQLKICKILISKPSKKWYNINQKMFDQKTKDEVKSCIDKLPKDTELWRQIKQLCQKAYEYADDKEKFKRWTKEQYIDSLQSQLDQQKARIEELEGQFAYECECNKQLVDLQKQLAEKNKEIERLKERLSVFDNFKDNYGYTNYDDSEILEDLQSRAFQAEDDTQVVNELLQFFNIFDENELVDKVKEPQTQLASQELEKVRDYAWFNYEKFRNYLNQQIKELKGENDERI